jgi:tetratricopeptide (TPR) repeat protein
MHSKKTIAVILIFSCASPVFGGDTHQLPSSAREYADRALVLQQKGSYTNAIAEYTAAIKLEPKNVTLLHNRGLAEFNLGKYDDAGTDFDKAIEIEPANAWFYNARGSNNMMRVRYFAARDDFQKAVSIDPSNEIFRDNLRLAGGTPPVVPRAPTPTVARDPVRATPQAQAQPFERQIPSYNVNQYCDELANLGGTYSYSLRNGCIDNEQGSYDKLVIIWPSLPFNVVDDCLSTNGFVSGGYSLLEGCITYQLGERANPHSFRR